MKPATTTAALVFLVIAAVHLLRLARGWEVIVNGKEIGSWPSWAAAGVAACLAFLLFREARRP